MSERACAEPCNCGYKNCTAWHVRPHANVQGVHFTKEEAVVVAAVLNLLSVAKEQISLNTIETMTGGRNGEQ